MHYENGTNTVEYGTGSTVCHQSFSGNYDAGHFDAIKNNSHTLEQYNVKKYMFKRSLAGPKEHTAKHIRNENNPTFNSL